MTTPTKWIIPPWWEGLSMEEVLLLHENFVELPKEVREEVIIDVLVGVLKKLQEVK